MLACACRNAGEGLYMCARIQRMVKTKALRCNLFVLVPVVGVLGKSYIEIEDCVYDILKNKSSIQVAKSGLQKKNNILDDARTKVFLRGLIRLLYVRCIRRQFSVAELSPFSLPSARCTSAEETQRLAECW